MGIRRHLTIGPLDNPKKVLGASSLALTRIGSISDTHGHNVDNGTGHGRFRIKPDQGTEYLSNADAAAKLLSRG